MVVKALPFELQVITLRKLGAKLAKDQHRDVVDTVEALDVLDSTLSYEENQALYFEELERRGIRTVPEEEKAASEMEKYVGQLVEETPELKEHMEKLTTELTVARTELGKLKEKHKKLASETKRWKELSEAERSRLSAESEELKRGLETLLGGLPRTWVESLMVVFMKIPKATEEAFWTWLREHLALAKEYHAKNVLAMSLEPQMKEWIEKRPPPPKVVEKPKPEAKFTVGSEAFELETSRKVLVRQVVWNELTRMWDYLIEDRGKIKRVPEKALVPLPAVERPARAPPAPRAPPTPKTLEEITKSPYTGKPLSKFPGPIPIVSYKEFRVTGAELRRRQEEGLPETEMRQVTEMLPMPPGLMAYVQDDKTAPDYGKFYIVEDFRLKPMLYDELVKRVQTFIKRIAPPAAPSPRMMVSPALAEPFKVPSQDEARFFDWLGAQGLKDWQISDPEQQRRLYSNWRELITGRPRPAVVVAPPRLPAIPQLPEPFDPKKHRKEMTLVRNLRVGDRVISPYRKNMVVTITNIKKYSQGLVDLSFSDGSTSPMREPESFEAVRNA